MTKDRQSGFLQRSRRFALAGAGGAQAGDGAAEPLGQGSVVKWTCGTGPNDFVAMTVDLCVAVGVDGAFIAGWLLESDGQVSEFHVAPEGDGAEPSVAGEKVARLDVIEAFGRELAVAEGSGPGTDIGFVQFVRAAGDGEIGDLAVTCSGDFGTRSFRVRPTADPDKFSELRSAYGEFVSRYAAGGSDPGGASVSALEAEAESAAPRERPRQRPVAPAFDGNRLPTKEGGELQTGRPVTWATGKGRGGDFAALSIDHCVPCGDDLLVVGWFLQSAPHVEAISLSCGGPAVDPRSDPQWVKPRPDVLVGFNERLRDANVKPRSEDVGFALVLTGAEGASRETLRIACMGEQGTQEFFVHVDDSAAGITAVVAEAWDGVSTALAPHLGPGLGETWWSALAHVSPVLTEDSPLEIRVDQCTSVPDSGPMLSGWWVNGTGDEVRVYVCDTKGNAVELTDHMIYGFRRDIHDLHKDEYDLRNMEQGFIALLSDLPVDEGDLLLAVAATRTQIVGRAVLDAPRSSSTAIKDVEALLTLVAPSHPELRRVMDAVGEAVRKIWAARPRPTRQVESFDFGTVPDNPKLSIIVPIYGRWDFIEYQLALFSHDLAMREHEILYMIDDPAIFEAVLLHARNIQPVFDVPFRVLYGHDNFGFAGANNAAASIARGEFLLLLNSDVMPKEPGWSERLLDSFARLDSAGAAGVRLLYHDGSLQHAGMRFERMPTWGGMWANLHPCKGQPASTDPADGPTRVDAVTGACMLVPADLYREVGGLDEGFIRGDFEDSDLCLKLAQRGLVVYYLPEIELYHLERQSQDLDDDTSMRAKITLYNCWQHTDRWDSTIEQVTSGADRG